MDISATTAPDSTQINAEDFLAGPRTVTITGVRKGTAEQPVNIDLAEYPDRAYRPGKSMRRVLVAAWGPDASAYVGRRLTLYCDPDISFGRERVGGIRISNMSHLDRKLTLALSVSRGKRAAYTVEPLKDTPAPAQVQPPKVDLAAAFRAVGITERDAMLAFAADTVGRDITSAADLSPDETAQVAAVLTELAGQPKDGAA